MNIRGKLRILKLEARYFNLTVLFDGKTLENGVARMERCFSVLKTETIAATGLQVGPTTFD